MYSKMTFFEGSAHVPMLIVPPEGKEYDKYRGTECNNITCLADIMPTCLNITDTNNEADLKTDGLDLLKQARGEVSRDKLFGWCFNNQNMLLTKQYKYIYSVNNGGELLFDIIKDPNECNNLADNAEFKDVLLDLKNRLIEKLKTHNHNIIKNDELPKSKLENAHLQKNAWPGFHTPMSACDVLH